MELQLVKKSSINEWIAEEGVKQLEVKILISFSKNNFPYYLLQSDLRMLHKHKETSVGYFSEKICLFSVRISTFAKKEDKEL